MFAFTKSIFIAYGRERVSHIRMMAGEADDKERRGYGDYFVAGELTAEHPIKAVENCRAIEGRLDIRVSRDQSSGCGDHDKCGHPVPALCNLTWEQPDVFLIVQDVNRQQAQRDVSSGRRDSGTQQENWVRLELLAFFVLVENLSLPATLQLLPGCGRDRFVSNWIFPAREICSRGF